jgi:hypothetical protein
MTSATMARVCRVRGPSFFVSRRSEAVKVDIFGAYVMIPGHFQMADLAEGEFGTVARYQK